MTRKHYNDVNRFQAPWIDAGLVKTRTAGKRRIWLLPPQEPGKTWWSAAVAGEGSTGGDSREQAMERARNW